MNDKIFRIINISTIGLFVLTVFLYFLAYVNPVLIESHQQPLFLFDDIFFNNLIEFPGGFAEYISLYLSQYFISKFWGSLIISVSVGLSVILSGMLLRKYISRKLANLIQFIPGILLIIMHSNYDTKLNIDIIYLISIALALVYFCIVKRGLYFKIPLVLFVTSLLFFLFGNTSAIFFALLIIAIEATERKKPDYLIVIPLQIVAAILLPYLVSTTSAHSGFKTLLKGIISKEIYPEIQMPLILIYLLVPVVLIITALICRKKEEKSRNKTNNKVLHIAVLFLIIIATVVTLVLSFNKKEKEMVMLNHHAKSENWEKVIDVANRLPFEDRKVIFQINRALYHKDLLLEEAFSYPQYWGVDGLILTSHYSKEVLDECSDLYYDMGHVKGSLHWAYEAQTKSGDSPEILKRIALANLILGEKNTAEKFLTILSKSPIHKKWAQKYLDYLNDKTKFGADKPLSEKRNLAPKEDFFSNTSYPESDLYQLLTQHPENKMALEYFVMNAMLKHDLATVVKHLRDFEKLSYQTLPRHVEEAVLMFMTLNDKYKPDLGKYKISKSSIERFTGYSKTIMKYKGNRKEAQSELNSSYGDTYWYYLQYVSPITSKREIKEK